MKAVASKIYNVPSRVVPLSYWLVVHIFMGFISRPLADIYLSWASEELPNSSSSGPIHIDVIKIVEKKDVV